MNCENCGAGGEGIICQYCGTGFKAAFKKLATKVLPHIDFSGGVDAATARKASDNTKNMHDNKLRDMCTEEALLELIENIDSEIICATKKPYYSITHMLPDTYHMSNITVLRLHYGTDKIFHNEEGTPAECSPYLWDQVFEHYKKIGFKCYFVKSIFPAFSANLEMEKLRKPLNKAPIGANGYVNRSYSFKVEW